MRMLKICLHLLSPSARSGYTRPCCGRSTQTARLLPKQPGATTPWGCSLPRWQWWWGRRACSSALGWFRHSMECIGGNIVFCLLSVCKSSVKLCVSYSDGWCTKLSTATQCALNWGEEDGIESPEVLVLLTEVCVVLQADDFIVLAMPKCFLLILQQVLSSNLSSVAWVGTSQFPPKHQASLRGFFSDASIIAF